METTNNLRSNITPPLQDNAGQATPSEAADNSTEAGNRSGFWQRVRNLFTNRQIISEEGGDLLVNEGNPIALFIDRFIHRRHCPYCFAYVSRRVYRLSNRAAQQVRVSDIPMSLPAYKTYICPTCKNELPFDFFKNKSSSLAVIGGTDAGKSSFITIFCELLLNRRTLLNDLGIFGSVINREGVTQIQENIACMVHQQQALEPTKTNTNRPVVIRLHSIHHKKVTYISLLDSPGEYSENKNEILDKLPNVQYANGIIFLMNPLDIDQLFRMLCKEKPAEVSPYKPVKVSNFQVTEALYEAYMQCGRIKPNRRIKTPAAFCLSRADLLDDIANIHMPPDFETDFTELDDLLGENEMAAEDVRQLMEETDLNLVNLLEKRFQHYSFFPVSPLGKAPLESSGGRKIQGGVNPRGVLQPIVWLLYKSKFIKQ